MGLKLGDIFDRFNEGIKNMSETFSGGKANAEPLSKDLTNEIEQLNNAAELAAMKIAELKEKLKNTKPEEEKAKINKKIEDFIKRANKLDERKIILDKKINDEAEAYIKSKSKESSVLGKISSKTKGHTDTQKAFGDSINNIIGQFKEGAISQDEMASGMKSADMFKGAGELFDTMSMGGEEAFGAVAGSFADVATEAFAAVPGLGEIVIAMEVLKKAIAAVYEQITKLNSALLEMQRNSAGMLEASDMGFDSLGNARYGVDSLETSVVRANVDIQQFSSAMGSLFSDGFGQIVGLRTNLKGSPELMKKFGIEAARMKKLWNTDLSVPVKKLMMNWHVGMGEAIDITKKVTESAKMSGLSMKEAASHLANIADMAGRYYFQSIKQMSDMSLMATALGTKTETLLSGITRMTHLTDLFTRQQKMMALGLSDYASNMQRVYALQHQGKEAEATKLQMSSILKDIAGRGLIDKNQRITSEGIFTLKEAGVSEDMINSLQKAGGKAQKFSVAIEDMIDPTKNLTVLQRKSLERKMRLDEENNMTIKESLNRSMGLVKQSLMDPLSKIFGPAIKFVVKIIRLLAEEFSSIMGVVSTVLMPVFTFISETFNQIGEFFYDAIHPVIEGFKMIQERIEPFYEMFSKVVKFLVKFILAPLRIMGKNIGAVIGWIADFIGGIFDAISDAFDFKSAGGMFEKLSNGIETFLDWLGIALKYLSPIFKVLGTIVGKILVGAFYAVYYAVYYSVIYPFKKIGEVAVALWKHMGWLRKSIQWIADAFSNLWKILKEFWEGLESKFSWLFGSSKSKEEGKNETKIDWDKMFGGISENNKEGGTAQKFSRAELETLMRQRSSSDYQRETEKLMRSEQIVQNTQQKTQNNVKVNVKTSGLYNNDTSANTNF